MAAPELRTLIESSTEELDSWLSQEIQDELGTRAFVLRAIAWCRRGMLGRARADIDAALAKRPAHEIVELTGAMTSFVLHDYDRAIVLLDGVARRHRYMAAQTLRLLIARASRLGWTAERRDAQALLRSLGVRDLRAHVEELQARRGTDDAEVVWKRVFEFGPEHVESLLRDASSPAATRVRARLELLRGRLDAAAALLESSDGDAESMALALAQRRLQDVLAHACTSARAWRLRAEAALALGDRDLAAQALAHATVSAPEHVHGLLLRVLIEQAPTRARMLELQALAPGLLSDAARELGIALWDDAGLLEQPEPWLRVCTHALSLLTPERAEAPISYRCQSGLGGPRLRHVPEPAHARTTHAEDAHDLAQAAQLLLKLLEKQRGTAHRATATRSLDADQIEQFMADGYVHLRGAFPRELADAIVASAHRRLREDPRHTLGEGPSQRWLDELGRYDPDDPSTWPEGRLDILGERRFTISEFSPFAERAVFQLLGDAARIRTRSWTSNLIAQYPVHQPIKRWVPGPTEESWHLDSPSTAVRIDGLLTGLLVFVVFSDLLPASGNTHLALDSPAKVAQRLAQSPEGVDFCSEQAGCAITRTCTRFFEVTGEAGDLLLVHPLMLHSASPNPSPRIRFLGNPMVYMQTPLDHTRKDASPVERLIAQALR